MEHLAQPVHSLPTLARLSGVALPRLRAILAAEDIKLLNWAWVPHKHLRGSYLDAIRFAVAAPLLARRFTAAEVSYVLGATVDELFCGLTGCFQVEIPRAVVLDRLHGRAIRVRFDVRGRLCEAGWARIGEPAESSEMTLTLYPSRLAEAVLERASAHKSTGAKLRHGALRAAGVSTGGRPTPYSTHAGPPAVVKELT